jgi:hypothetical protein
MKNTSSRFAGLALAATIAMAACAHQTRYATEDFAGRDIAVEVTNHNWADVVVYAVSYGNRVRLGSVTTGLDQRFRLPKTVNVASGGFHLEAHPVGSHEIYRSEPIMVSPGGRIIWSLENQLGLSSYRIAAAK